MKQRGAEEESRWREMFVIFILSLQFAGALSRDLTLYISVRAGDDITLPCENVIDGHSNCDTTAWLHSGSRQSEPLLLAEHGKIKHGHSDRLSVSANCSLVLQKVTAEDVGRFTCRQFISGNQSGPDALVYLSVVNLTEHQDGDRVTLSCFASTYERCRLQVKWLFKGSLDKENQAIKESSSSCSAAVTFQTSHYIYPARFDLFKCEVKTDGDKFTFSPRPPVKSTTAVTENPTISTAVPFRKTSPSLKPETRSLEPAGKTGAAKQGLLWLYITVVLVTVAMIIAAAVLIVLKRTKANKIQQKSSNVDPEDGVSYASISFKKSNNNNKIKSDDEGDAVTYSTLKAPSTDPSSLEASIKKPNKPD